MINTSSDKSFLGLTVAKREVEAAYSSPVRVIKLVREAYAEAYRHGCAVAHDRVAKLEYMLRSESQVNEGLRGINEELQGSLSEMRDEIGRLRGQNAQMDEKLNKADDASRVNSLEGQLRATIERYDDLKRFVESMKAANESLSIRIVAANGEREDAYVARDAAIEALDAEKRRNDRLVREGEDEIRENSIRLDECRHTIRMMLSA